MMSSSNHDLAPRLPVLYIIIAVLLSVMLLSLILSLTAACRRRLLYSREKRVAVEVEEEGRGEEEQEAPLIPGHPTSPRPGSRLSRKVSFRDCVCASR